MPRRPPISNETSRAYERASSFAECSQKTWIICICFRSCSQPIWRRLKSVLFLAWKTASKELTCFGTGAILGPADDHPECNSHVGARKNHSTVADAPSDAVTCSFGRTQDIDYAIARLLRLEHFERFVFVMSVLEKYSDQDCSVLLGCRGKMLGRQECERCCISRSLTGYEP